MTSKIDYLDDKFWRDYSNPGTPMVIDDNTVSLDEYDAMRGGDDEDYTDPCIKVFDPSTHFEIPFHPAEDPVHPDDQPSDREDDPEQPVVDISDDNYFCEEGVQVLMVVSDGVTLLGGPARTNDS